MEAIEINELSFGESNQLSCLSETDPIDLSAVVVFIGVYCSLFFSVCVGEARSPAEFRLTRKSRENPG